MAKPAVAAQTNTTDEIEAPGGAAPAPTQAASPAVEPKPDTLFVQDTTCVAGYEADGKTPMSRTHVQIVDGMETPFVFTYGKKTEMPTGVAMKFLPIDEFVVTDHAGKRVTQVPKQPDEHSRKPFMLRDDQVVADLGELSDDALWKRTQQAIGGEKLARSDGRGRMVAFLTEARRAQMAARRGPGDGSAPAGAAAAGDVAEA